MSVTKIVITGEPCAGKSTAMSRIQHELTQLGYKVYFIAESATEVITSGVTPDLNNSKKLKEHDFSDILYNWDCC